MLRRSVLLCAAVLLSTQCAAQAQTPTYVPPTQAERNRHYLRSLISPMALLGAAASAGISQWEDTPREWKQGAEGYGHRIGTSFAYHVASETMEFGASSLLGEDNRYIPLQSGAAGVRVKYAIESTFLARRRGGSRRLSYSRIGATLGAAFLSRAWQPPSTRGPEHAVESFAISMAVQAGFNVGHEFVPFLRRHG
jgi:hypothetical protein